jgi:hypothetical protein
LRPPFAATLAVVAMAGCGAGTSSSPQLVDGSPSPHLPAALESLDNAVVTRVRVLHRTEPLRRELRMCLYPASGPLPRRPTLVERVGRVGRSLTVAPAAGSALVACDAILAPAADPDRPRGSPWCGASYGRTVGRRLTDPRLDLCTGAHDELTAFAWVQPARRTRWVVIRDGGGREVYPVAGGWPVRVTTRAGIDAESSSASFDVEEYGRDGTRLRSYTLRTGVAG